MSNQIAAGKKRINVVLKEEQIKRLDARAVELETTRASLISQAVDALLDGVPERDCAAAKLEAISAKLDAMDAAQRLAVAGVLDAVKNQPIAVQQQLTAPDLTRESVAEWLKANEPNAVALDCWGEPCIKRTEQQPRQTKSRFARAVDALLGHE